MQEFTLENNVYYWSVETPGNCSDEVSEEILRDSKLDKITLLTEIKPAEGVSIVQALESLRKVFTDTPIVYRAGVPGKSDPATFMERIRAMISAIALDFYNLEAVYQEPDCVYFVMNNKASMELVQRVWAIHAAVLLHDVLCDEALTDIALSKLSDWSVSKSCAEKFIAGLKTRDDDIAPVSSFDEK